MADYAHVEMSRLETELSYVPARLRMKHLGRIIRLLPKLCADQLYSYDTIFYQVTRFHPDGGGEKLLSGAGLLRDLGLLLQRFSRETPLTADVGDDRVETVRAIAARQRVMFRTVQRWGLQGLALCWYRFENGQCALGVRLSALARFFALRSRCANGSATKVTDAERRALLERVAVLQAKGGGYAEIVRQVSRESGRSLTTVRRLLRAQKEEVERLRVRRRRGGMDEKELDVLVERYREGRCVRDLADDFGRSVSTIYRVLHEALLARVLALNIRYLPSPEFAGPDAETVCLGADGLFTFPPEPGPKMMKAPEGLTPYLRSLYEIPLLTRAREMELFRKYNYIKYRMAMLQELVRGEGYRANLIDEFDRLRQAAEQVRRIVIRCNLRLVVSIAKRHTGPLACLMDLVSEGNMCLIRAVECYDYRREARFATYGTWALTKHFARVVPEENYHLRTFMTGRDEFFVQVGDAHANQAERLEAVAHVRNLLGRATRHLTAREREIVESHYGTNGRSPRTLEEIGHVFGLTRERIRQIEAHAFEKLRGLMGKEGMEALA